MSLRLKTTLRLGIVAAAGAVAFLVLGTLSLLDKRQTLDEEHRYRLATMTDLAVSVVQYRYQQAAHGELSQEAARSLAARDVTALQDGENNRLWINDFDGILIAHPSASDRIGSNLIEMIDARGKAMFQAFVNTARNGGGYVDYEWISGSKLTHVRPFDPWGWAIVADTSVEGIEATFEADIRRHVALTAAFVIVAGGLVLLMSVQKSTPKVGSRESRPAGGSGDLDDAIQAVRRQVARTAAALDAFRKSAIEELRSAGNTAQHRYPMSTTRPSIGAASPLTGRGAGKGTRPWRFGNPGLALVVSLIATALVLLNTNLLEKTINARYDARVGQYVTISEITKNLIEDMYREQAEGGTTTERAQTETRSIIRNIHFDEDKYFLTLDYEGVVIVSRPNRAMEGSIIIDVTDPYGFPLIQELINAARSGGGEVTYHWPSTRSVSVTPILAYATPFEPWEWLLVTSLRLNDLEDASRDDRVAAHWRLGMALAILLVLALLVADWSGTAKHRGHAAWANRPQRRLPERAPVPTPEYPTRNPTVGDSRSRSR